MLEIKKLGLTLVLTIFSIGMIACGGGTTTENKPATNKPAENKPAENKPAENKPASNTTASTGDKIGIAECDEYIEKYEACIMSKMPEAGRAAAKSALDQSRKAWKDAAATPAKSTLAASCKQMLDTAKQTTAAYGCTW